MQQMQGDMRARNPAARMGSPLLEVQVPVLLLHDLDLTDDVLLLLPLLVVLLLLLLLRALLVLNLRF